jgi:uncharacterized cupin superfamily protein
MKLQEITAKGLDKCLAAPGLIPDKFTIHITEVEPGSRPHDAHTHSGIEVFYLLEGSATVESENERYALKENEAIAVDATRLHGIYNSSTTRVRYIVMIAK